MDVLDPLLADDAEAWVSALPQYQQDIVLSFLDQDGDPAVAATQCLPLRVRATPSCSVGRSLRPFSTKAPGRGGSVPVW